MDEVYIDQLRDMEDEVARINEYLNAPAPKEPGALTERLAKVSAFNARTGEMLADAEYILTLQRGEVLSELLSVDPKMPANQQKTLVDAKCAYAIKVCRLIERANRSAVHAGEALITLVSMAKEEMSLTRKGY